MMKIEANIPGRGLTQILIDGGHIASVEPLGETDNDLPYVSPGLIDIQVNGFAGVDFSDPLLTSEQLAAVLPAIWKTGVTTFCPTLITNAYERLLRNFHVFEEARRLFPQFARCVPCYHLEGPYISPNGARGAHAPQYIRLPDWREFEKLQQAAGGHIGILTLAPELPGASDFIRRACSSKIVVAIGHTDANAAEIHNAVTAGARLSTHLGNGCPDMIHRHLNPLWAQLAADELSASIICDGFHLPPDLVKVILGSKTISKCVLITDAVSAATMAPGRYKLVDTEIELLPSRKVVSGDGKTMAGSAATLNHVVELFGRYTGVTLHDALAAATANPAGILGKPAVCSHIAKGQPANLFLFRREALSIKTTRVFVGGQQVYNATDSS
ncbi:MAG TPA: amidohydrolase family protein [Terriglobia bacterium]|nr:amidohydrolase family protein [Terriglobia bacterium]